MMVYRAEKEAWRYLQQSLYNTRTWQTDGRTDRKRTPTDSKDSASINQSINQFNSNLAAREPDSKWYAVEI